MKQIIRYFITYPIWANAIMAIILIMGFVAMKRMKTSFFPEVESNRILVNIFYPGTSPEEIEESLILKIENNLKGIAGIDRTTSISRENSGQVTIEVSDYYDRDDIYNDVKNAVDQISPYPSGAERPIITVPKIRTRAISVALYANTSLWALKERAEEFRDDLLALEEISQVTVEGIPKREIAITVSEDNLHRYEITFSDIAQAIRSANIDLSSGSIKTKDEQLLIRTYGRRDFAHEIGALILKTNPDGTSLRISDIAQVTEQWEDSPQATYYNKQRAVIVEVSKTLKEDIIAISERVNEYVTDFSKKHPEISIKTISDSTIHLKQRINLLLKNGMFGFFLVILTLFFFVNGKISFLVAVGIPISFAGMFIIAYLWGITINVISLMGMLIVVGVLVDDAIVVAESIYQKSEQGLNPFQAAIQGLLEVISPVFTAVLTTIFAFLPFFFFQGTMGRFIYQLALVVIGALIFSLVESIFILPAHLVHSKGLNIKSTTSKLRKTFDNVYKWLIHKVYGPALHWALHNIGITLALPIAYWLISFGLIRGNIVEFSAFPFIDRDDITLSLTMTTGTREHVTDSILQNIEKRIEKLNNQLKLKRPDKKDVILSIRRQIGSNKLGDRGGHAGSLKIELLEGSVRKIQSFKVAGMLRKAIGTVPGSQKLSFGGGHWGKAISISLLSNNLNELNRAKEILKTKLAEYPSINDITDSDIEGWREVRLDLKPIAYAAGFTIREVANQIRQGFFGNEVQRFQRGEDEIRVWIRYTDEDRSSLGKLENMYIKAKNGKIYPLSSIANYTIKRGRVTISHLDGKREIRVEADLVNPEQSVNTLLKDIRKNVVPKVLAQVNDVYVSYEGRERHNKKFLKSLKASFPIALIGIALILVLVFRSVLQAGIIFLMIPLGLMGAVWGHLFHGFLITRLSTFGVIALIGIVINDSIVFIDKINRNLKSGMLVFDAVYKAGLSRLRPIILTTITTVVGMTPLIFEGSRQAQFLKPMAVSISYGLIFGSIFILFIVPALFLVLNKFRLIYERLFDYKATAESVEPAVRELAAEQKGTEE